MGTRNTMINGANIPESNKWGWKASPTGMCGLYGWVYFRCKICRNGYITLSLDLGFKIIHQITGNIMVKNRQKSQRSVGLSNNRPKIAKKMFGGGDK